MKKHLSNSKKWTKPLKRKSPEKSQKKVRLKNLQVDEKVKSEVERLIKKFKKERKKKFEPHEIIWGYIKMTKYYKLNNELELVLFDEQNHS